MTVHNKLVLGNTGKEATFEQVLIWRSVVKLSSEIGGYRTVRDAYSSELRERFYKEVYSETILLSDKESSSEVNQENASIDTQEEVVSFINNVYNQFGNYPRQEEVINFLKKNVSSKNVSFKLVKDIMVDECFGYFCNLFAREVYISKEISKDYNMIRKIEEVMIELIEHFSVAQIYYIIWRHVKTAINEINQGYIEVSHGIYKAAEECKKYGEQAINRGWGVKSYNPDPSIRRSSICKVCFDEVLEVGDKWFFEPIYKLYMLNMFRDVS